MQMQLDNLGWKQYKKGLAQENSFPEENVARVAIENRGGYSLYSPSGELEGIMRGKFMRGKKANSAYPKVGDWVIFEKLIGEKKAIIESILPRISQLSRNKVGEVFEEQIIAANIDIVFIVQGLNGDFNLSRLERYVTMAHEGNCEPIILLNKCDAINDAQEKISTAKKSLSGIKIFLVSARDGIGIEHVQSLIDPGVSLVFVGSSGAGKSTIINRLLGANRQKTGTTRTDDSKGRHTTTRRELILLENGGIIIDTPGMRELGIWTQEKAVAAETFKDIDALIGSCKFNDCNHNNCKGCAITEAVSEGKISLDRYQRFLKISQEAGSGNKKTWA